MKKILYIIIVFLLMFLMFNYIKNEHNYNLQNNLINKNNYYYKIDYKFFKEYEEQRNNIEYCQKYYNMLKEFELYIMINNDNKEIIKILNEKEKKGLIKKEEKQKLINITEMILNTKKIGFSVYYFNVCINKIKYNNNII